MRKISLVFGIWVAFMGMQVSVTHAGTFNSSGVFQGTVSASVESIFSGSLDPVSLENAVFNLLVADPSLAADVAFRAAKLSTALQVAVGRGMGRAVNTLVLACTGQRCSANLQSLPEDIINAVLSSGNTTLLTAGSGTSGGYMTALGAFIPPANYRTGYTSAGTQIGGCVGSPC